MICFALDTGSADSSSCDYFEVVGTNECLLLFVADLADLRVGSRLQVREAQGRAVDEGLSVTLHEDDRLWLRQDGFAHLISRARCSGPVQSSPVMMMKLEFDLHRSLHQVLENLCARCDSRRV